MTVGDVLDPAEIARLACGFDLEVHDLVDSTQSRARQRVAQGRWQPAAVIANAQSAGCGQRGRVWQSPPAAALYLTLIWPSARPLAGLAGLSLVVGLGVRAALAQCQVDARLKWPNDVWVDQRKLAGILVELVPVKPQHIALIGIGLNIRLPPEAGAAIDQPWTDLAQILNTPPPRNLLIGLLLPQLQRHLTRFESGGVAAFLAEWQDADALADQPIWLHGPSGRETGQALGIDTLGRLKVAIDGRERSIAAGTISIRPITMGDRAHGRTEAVVGSGK